jgi:hypothetical protein
LEGHDSLKDRQTAGLAGLKAAQHPDQGWFPFHAVAVMQRGKCVGVRVLFAFMHPYTSNARHVQQVIALNDVALADVLPLCLHQGGLQATSSLCKSGKISSVTHQF